MKTISTFFLAPLFFLLTFNSFSQKRTIKKLHFEIKEYDLTDVNKKKILNYYDKLNTGEELELILHTNKEEKLNRPQYLIKATNKRAVVVAKFIKINTVANEENIEVKRFNKSQKSYSGSNASYRNFAKHTVSEVSLVVTKPILIRKFTRQKPLVDTLVRNNFGCNSEILTVSGSFFKATIKKQDLDLKNCADCDLIIRHQFYHSKSDFVLNNLTSTSNGKILVSGGMLFINVFCGLKKVKLKPNKTFRLTIYNIEDDRKYLPFEGEMSEGIVNWELDNKSNKENFKEVISEIGEEEEEEEEEEGYDLFPKSFGWINCDAFYDVPKKELANLVIKTEMKYKASVRMVFKEMKTVLPGYTMGITNNVQFSNIPRGKEVTIISFTYSKDKNMVRWNSINTVTEDNQKLELKLENESSIAEFKKILSATL
jgi:hypothetical protein